MQPQAGPTPTPGVDSETAREFTSALIYADSIALAVGVLCLFIAIVFRLANIENPKRNHTRELVLTALVFILIGNTAVTNAYPYSAVVKASGYMLGSAFIAWKFGRLFERYTGCRATK